MMEKPKWTFWPTQYKSKVKESRGRRTDLGENLLRKKKKIQVRQISIFPERWEEIASIEQKYKTVKMEHSQNRKELLDMKNIWLQK